MGILDLSRSFFRPKSKWGKLQIMRRSPVQENALSSCSYSLHFDCGQFFGSKEDQGSFKSVLDISDEIFEGRIPGYGLSDSLNNLMKV